MDKKILCRRYKRHSGFSLVEISGVAILIALLVGATFAGLSLRHSTELKSIMTEYKKYQEAVGLFQSRFNALPGDMLNATDYWGVLDADAEDCQETPSTTFQTCNGNGDGMIGATNETLYESFRAWQHLANARLIEGSYTGERTATGVDKPCNRTNHCGMSRFDSAFFYMATPTDELTGGTDTSYEAYFRTSGDAEEPRMFRGDKGNVIVFAGPITASSANAATTGQDPIYPVLLPEDALAIDSKHDDGRPGTGSIQVFVNHSSTMFDQVCSTPSSLTDATDPDPAAATYNTNADESAATNNASKGAQCTLIFKDAF